MDGVVCIVEGPAGEEIPGAAGVGQGSVGLHLKVGRDLIGGSIVSPATAIGLHADVVAVEHGVDLAVLGGIGGRVVGAIGNGDLQLLEGVGVGHRVSVGDNTACRQVGAPDAIAVAIQGDHAGGSGDGAVVAFVQTDVLNNVCRGSIRPGAVNNFKGNLLLRLPLSGQRDILMYVGCNGTVGVCADDFVSVCIRHNPPRKVKPNAGQVDGNTHGDLAPSVGSGRVDKTGHRVAVGVQIIGNGIGFGGQNNADVIFTGNGCGGLSVGIPRHGRGIGDGEGGCSSVIDGGVAVFGPVVNLSGILVGMVLGINLPYREGVGSQTRSAIDDGGFGVVYMIRVIEVLGNDRPPSVVYTTLAIIVPDQNAQTVGAATHTDGRGIHIPSQIEIGGVEGKPCIGVGNAVTVVVGNVLNGAVLALVGNIGRDKAIGLHQEFLVKIGRSDIDPVGAAVLSHRIKFIIDNDYISVLAFIHRDGFLLNVFYRAVEVVGAVQDNIQRIGQIFVQNTHFNVAVIRGVENVRLVQTNLTIDRQGFFPPRS